MAKIAMPGAGSLVFCKTLMADFLATPALAGSEYRLSESMRATKPFKCRSNGEIRSVK
jgi:alpha-galactosidase/6-phospho-beta-glucosidase family protein